MLERGKSDFPELPHYYTQIFSFQQQKKITRHTKK